MTSAKQIYLGSRRGPALPYDAEVEYLESILRFSRFSRLWKEAA